MNVQNFRHMIVSMILSITKLKIMHKNGQYIYCIILLSLHNTYSNIPRIIYFVSISLFIAHETSLHVSSLSLSHTLDYLLERETIVRIILTFCSRQTKLYIDLTPPAFHHACFYIYIYTYRR